MRGLVSVCSLTLCVSMACAGCQANGTSSSPATPRAPSATAPPVPAGSAGAFGTERPALRVLHRWDARRARAYASGDAATLRSLYLPGSQAAAADVRVLRAYAARGLRVRGIRMQVLEVRVLAHRPGLWRLRVTDRLHHAVAVGPDGRRVALPHADASTHDIVLRRDRGVWRVAAVR